MRTVIPAPSQRGKLQPESRVPGENRDPVFEMVPDFHRGRRLDAPVSSTGLAPQVRHDGKGIFVDWHYLTISHAVKSVRQNLCHFGGLSLHPLQFSFHLRDDEISHLTWRPL